MFRPDTSHHQLALKGKGRQYQFRRVDLQSDFLVVDDQENTVQASVQGIGIRIGDHGTAFLTNAMVSLHPAAGTIVVLPQRPQPFVDVPRDPEGFSLIDREILDIDVDVDVDSNVPRRSWG